MPSHASTHCSKSGQTTTCTTTYTYPPGTKGQRQIKRTRTCTTHGGTRSCEITYTYASQATNKAWRVIAMANVHGRQRAIGSGSLAQHKLALKLTALAPGQYHVVLVRVQVIGRRTILTAIGHTTITVS
jgi:hypothetical protein